MNKFLFLLIFLVSTIAVFSQTTENSVVPAESNGVEDIYLTKDDGSGKNGDVAEIFATTDVPIHCVVMLNSDKSVTVKMNFIAVSVKGVKPESKVVSVSYKTDGKQNMVNFTGKPDGVWTVGNYRVDIFFDGKPAGNRAFEIQKSGGKIENASPAIKRFASPKNMPKPKIGNRRLAKN